MEKDPRLTFQKWRRLYGDVFSLYMADRLVIVLNTFDVIKEAFVKLGDAFSDRPSMFISDEICKGNGVLATSGQHWKEQRKLILEIFRELGVGKNFLAEKIQEEVTMYVKELHSYQGQPTDIRRMTQVSVSNNICSIVFGKRFDYDDPVFSGYLHKVDENVTCLTGAAILTFFPWLRYVPGDPTKGKKVLKNVKAVEDEFIKPQIKEHFENYADGPATDFIHAYIREIRKREASGEPSTIDVDNLEMCIGDLFVAGTETTSTGICWAVVLLQNVPQVQEKCFREICDVIGSERAPSMRDRPEMTYLEATIMEVLRWSCIPPFTLQHSVAFDVSLNGHTIPKDAMIMANLESVLHDPMIWSDPLEFRPERFIGSDGKLTRPDEFIPFGIGRRVCLGESIARMELFLYLAAMIQRFQFLPAPEDGASPSLERVFGMVCTPRPFKVRAVPRQ